MPTAYDEKAWKHEWYLRNREKLLAQSKARREANKESIAAKKKAYRLAHLAERRLANKRWQEANPEKKRAAQRRYREKRSLEQNYLGHLKRAYGLNPEEYSALLLKQNGVCAICKEPPGSRCLDVDHCHDTEAVRGLLCRRCNLGVGFIDSMEHEKFLILLDYLGLGLDAALGTIA